MDWLSIAALVVSLIVGLYLFVSRQTPLTAANVTTAINAVPSLATEVEKAATVVIQSYEQARRKGKLVNDPPLNKVMNQVRDWLPDWAKVKASNDQIVEAINSAILMASLVTNQINAAKTVVQESDAPPMPQSSAPLTGYETFTGRQP